MTTVNVSRRGFLNATGGLVLGLVLPGKDRLAAQQIGTPPPICLRRRLEGSPTRIFTSVRTRASRF